MLGTFKQAYAWHRYEQADVRLLYSGSWSTTRVHRALPGANYKQANTKSASLDFIFTRQQVDWIATTGPGMGKADISVDGGPMVTVDLFGDTTALYRQKVWSSPTLPDGYHRVQITVSKTSASGAPINVDAVDVHGSLPAASSATAAKMMWAEQRLKELSYLPGVVNGTFDTKTRGAVIAFEKWRDSPGTE